MNPRVLTKEEQDVVADIGHKLIGIVNESGNNQAAFEYALQGGPHDGRVATIFIHIDDGEPCECESCRTEKENE